MGVRPPSLGKKSEKRKNEVDQTHHGIGCASQMCPDKFDKQWLKEEVRTWEGVGPSPEKGWARRTMG